MRTRRQQRETRVPTWFRIPTVTEVIALAGLIWGASSLVGNLNTTQTLLTEATSSLAKLTETVNTLVTRVEVLDTRVRILEELKKK